MICTDTIIWMLYVEGQSFLFQYLTQKNPRPRKQTIMGNLLYTVAVVLLILWLIGFIGYNVGGIIHILLIIAVIAVLFRLIRGKGI
jgi:hypothetical protein